GHRADRGDHGPVQDRLRVVRRWWTMPGETRAGHPGPATFLKHAWTLGSTRLHRHDRHLQ
ncbi:MAG TPA: hypothetical protein VG013_08535, partial [Gemmataceae bacterium]|nr:hypothetical protein [Gemmataceae bacterium]